MARFAFPDEGSRLVYKVNGAVLGSAANQSVTFYTDAAGTVLAGILTEAGAAVPTASLLVDASSRLPIFQGPDGVDTLYARVNGGVVSPVYARTDDRLDALPALAASAAAGATAGKLDTTAASATYATLATAAAQRRGMEARALADQTARRRVPGQITLTQSAASAASAIAGGVVVPAVTDTVTGALNPTFRYSRARVRQRSTTVFEDDNVVSILQTFLGATPFATEFVYTGAVLELRFRAQFTSQARVIVDDTIVNATPLATANDGSFRYLTLTMPDARPRLIRLEAGTSFAFRGAVRESTATLSRPTTGPDPRLLFLGDSYTGATGAASTVDGFSTETGRLLNLPDVCAASGGGTGYLQVNNDATFPFPKYRDRLAVDVYPLAPDIVVVSGGQNDAAGGFTAAAIQTEAGLLLDALRTNLPSAALFVVLPFSIVGNPGPGLLAVRDGVAAAALARSVPTVDPIAEQWITGTGDVGTPNSTGNADLFTGADRAHPSPAGHDFYARKIAAALRQRGLAS